MIRVIPLFVVLMLISFTGCGKSRQAIENYAGDGIARHLKSPGLGGIDGVAIELPHFDMSQGLNAQYDLKGIPPGTPYIVYLVVPLPVEEEKRLLSVITQGVWTFSAHRDKELMAQVSSPLSEAIDNQFCDWVTGPGTNKVWTSFNRFYDESSVDNRNMIRVMSHSENWTLSVTVSNQVLNESVDAYILIERGGFK